MEKIIYMPLLGKGTESWRPVRAVQITADVFEVCENIHENESWAFAPLSRVRCRDTVFADGRTGLAVFAYAVETNPFYQLIKGHQGQVFRVVLTDNEEAVIRVIHVDGEHEDFIYDLLSTNLDSKYRDKPKNAAYATKFSDLVFARLQE
jgi:hypothetical protein